MTDGIWDDGSDDLGGTQPDNSPAGLRKAVDKANAAAKKAADEATSLKSENRTLKIGQLLTANGINAEKFAVHVPTDLAADKDAIQGWIKANQDTFNFGLNETVVETKEPAPAETKPGEQPAPAGAPAGSEIDPKLVDQLVAMGVLSDRGQALQAGDRQKLAETLAAAEPKTIDEAKDMLKQFGLEFQDTSGYKF